MNAGIFLVTEDVARLRGLRESMFVSCHTRPEAAMGGLGMNCGHDDGWPDKHRQEGGSHEMGAAVGVLAICLSEVAGYRYTIFRVWCRQQLIRAEPPFVYRRLRNQFGVSYSLESCSGDRYAPYLRETTVACK